MLREMINELEETKLKLLLNIKELKEKLVQQKDDQADIYFYLNKKCDESFEVIASLEEQIINEQTDREIAEKMYENRIEEQKTAHHTMEAKHLSKISELETRLEMLNSFNDEKEESEKNLKILMNKLEEERTQFRVNTENIENRFLVERDKLRKTYDQKYEKIKKELESSVEVKMSNKTKKTQLMNVIMKKELDNQVTIWPSFVVCFHCCTLTILLCCALTLFQSKHAEKLLEINQSMLERDKGLKLELDVVKGLHDDMTLRLTMSQRTIKQLNEKVVALEAAEATARQKHDAEMHTKVRMLSLYYL